MKLLKYAHPGGMVGVCSGDAGVAQLGDVRGIAAMNRHGPHNQNVQANDMEEHGFDTFFPVA